MRRHLKGFLCLVIFSAAFSCSKKPPEIAGMVYIPAGEFIMGSEEVDTEAMGREFGLRKGRYYEDESPKRKVSLDAFYMDKYEVTNRQ
ncbi:MAG: SUMF1/EgtB/PvdO family nonheme iron enzyme, partial [Deltaproteobacteria bacterium]|nr:SUMF1/EgtB/PvdO family nonheme iron enzyme [Deltaproteobacteria bacterium]